jgi:hypothetical protein
VNLLRNKYPCSSYDIRKMLQSLIRETHQDVKSPYAGKYGNR